MFSASKSKGASGSYQIANSLRFRSSASAYLNRTPASAGNQKTWTLSFWLKRGMVGTGTTLYWVSNLDSGGINGFGFATNGNDNLSIFDISSSVIWQLVTSQVFRDPSAWYHIVLAIDTTQATASNRAKLYVNGAQVTAFSTATYPTQNSNTYWNNTSLAAFARPGAYNGLYFDGYLADINFIDGQALTPSSFGQISTVTGVWQPKAYSGTYGTNGFKLNFSNGTSTTTLGYDSSGNSNNWTTNNISLTAGSTYDWMLDSPTPLVGTSYGVGNYAVLNPLDPNVSGLSVTISNGNLTASGSTYGANVYTASMQIPSSGKWYYETVYSTITSTVVVGIRSYTTGSTDVQYRSDGQKTVGSTTSAYGSSWTTNDVIAVAVDRNAGTVTFYKNNTAQGAISIPTNSAAFDMAWGVASPYGSTTFSVTFGQRPFSYTPPTGFKALNTQNLPAASIVNGASYMAATTYTGNGSTQSITNTVNGVSFQPDFVWIKSRGTADNHQLQDSVRGATKRLFSNLTDAESTDATSLTSFNSNGFSLGNSTNYNGSGYSFIAWNWKANGTAVSNTAGSITSQVSANTTAGFSVVTYTGNGTSGATVGHGLGVAINMVIIKNRASTYNWRVGHSSLPSWSYFLQLDGTNAQTSNNVIFNGVTPTSTVFTLGNDVSVNASGQSHVAYCFAAIAGYSAFGSYTGNGSADGPFVYTGFRPRYVMVKCSSSNQAGNADWRIQDSARDPYNVVGNMLFADLNNAESTGNALMDLLSNGFKLRGTSTGQNASGATYIYAAFCEVPFNFALGR
jgi:hypothetical protein